MSGVAGPVKDRAHLVPAASSLGSEHCGIHRHRGTALPVVMGMTWNAQDLHEFSWLFELGRWKRLTEGGLNDVQ